MWVIRLNNKQNEFCVFHSYCNVLMNFNPFLWRKFGELEEIEPANVIKIDQIVEYEWDF